MQIAVSSREASNAEDGSGMIDAVSYLLARVLSTMKAANAAIWLAFSQQEELPPLLLMEEGSSTSLWEKNSPPTRQIKGSPPT